MKNKRRNETIAAKVLSRFDSGSGNQEVEIHMATIEEFIEIHAVRMKECNKIHQNPYMTDFKGDNWEVVLHRPGKGNDNEFVTYFSKGIGHKGKRPTVPEVLDCIASDAAGYENSKNFEDWAIESGCDIGSRRAETIYHNVKAASLNMKNFLGKEAYETLLWETERM